MSSAPSVNLSEIATAVLNEQAQALQAVALRVNGDFQDAIDLIFRVRGHLVVSGVGKSGLVGQKMSATFASTGTPAFSMHPTEAFHGDLGSVTAEDAVLLISYSGETEELTRLLAPLRAQGVPVLAMTGNARSTLARQADAHLSIAVEKETCPHNLAPTTSTTVTMALGDALAVALMHKRGFEPADFAKFHPGGSLGKALATVGQRMFRKDLPVVSADQGMPDLVRVMTAGRMGVALVCDASGTLQGVVTDGDLRRAMNLLFQTGKNCLVADIMTHSPVTITDDIKMAEAKCVLEQRKIKVLPVVDQANRLIGVIEWSLFV